MNIVTFFKINNLDKIINIYRAESCYQDSDTPIQYIKLSKELDNGQTSLVLSRALAEELDSGKLTISDAHVQSYKGKYGLIRPDRNVVIATVELW